MKKILFLLIVFAFPNIAYSACDATGCTTTIKRVYLTGLSDGRIYIEPTDKPNGIVNCTPAENIFFVLESDHKLFKEIYSGALSAMMANKRTRLRISENTQNCKLLYLMIFDQ